MSETQRCLVTGQNSEGKSVFVSDEGVEFERMGNGPPQSGLAKLWGSNQTITVPSAGSAFDYDANFPLVGGFRYFVTRIAPGHDVGMHMTATVDIGVVLEGELWLELDDGAEQRLTSGDVFVQNGTQHAWHNRSSQVCKMAVVLIGAETE